MRERLREEIRAAQERASGEPIRFDDCLIWLADIYRNVLGVDPAEPWRGAYADEAELRELLGWRGVPGALKQAAQDMGWTVIPPREAQIGDLGMVQTPGGPAGVVHAGQGYWLGRIDMGFAGLPDTLVRKAWSVHEARSAERATGKGES